MRKGNTERLSSLPEVIQLLSKQNRIQAPADQTLRPRLLTTIFLIKKATLHEVRVAQLCPTLCDTMGYTVHRILQVRILEWVRLIFLNPAVAYILKSDFSKAKPITVEVEKIHCEGRYLA